MRDRHGRTRRKWHSSVQSRAWALRLTTQRRLTSMLSISARQLSATFEHFAASESCMKISDIKTVATAMVSSRLDYCNSLLYGMTDCNISKLQRVQNSLARLATNNNSRCHITPVLAEFHWLPVSARIEYNVALLAYKAMTINRPIYLNEILKLYKPVRQLCSSSHCSLYVMMMLDNIWQSCFLPRSTDSVELTTELTITDEFQTM